MEIRNDSRRLGICQRKKSFDESRPLRFNVLEEAKRLEYLNRKIKKSSHRNIIKEIAGYRKSVSPNQRNLNKIYSNLYRYYDELFKVDLNDLKNNSDLIGNNVKTVVNAGKFVRRKKRREVSEFDEIEFNDFVWPEELIVHDKVIEESELKGFGSGDWRSPLARKQGRGACRFKSRLGEIGRKVFRVEKKKSEDCLRSPARGM